MLSSLVSLGLGAAADKVIWTTAKAALPVAKTLGEKVIQKVGCMAISAGVGYALDQMISEVAKPMSKIADLALGVYIIEEEEAEMVSSFISDGGKNG